MFQGWCLGPHQGVSMISCIVLLATWFLVSFELWLGLGMVYPKQFPALLLGCDLLVILLDLGGGVLPPPLGPRRHPALSREWRDPQYYGLSPDWGQPASHASHVGNRTFLGEFADPVCTYKPCRIEGNCSWCCIHSYLAVRVDSIKSVHVSLSSSLPLSRLWGYHSLLESVARLWVSSHEGCIFWMLPLMPQVQSVPGVICLSSFTNLFSVVIKSFLEVTDGLVVEYVGNILLTCIYWRSRLVSSLLIKLYHQHDARHHRYFRLIHVYLVASGPTVDSLTGR